MTSRTAGCLSQHLSLPSFLSLPIGTVYLVLYRLLVFGHESARVVFKTEGNAATLQLHERIPRVSFLVSERVGISVYDGVFCEKKSKVTSN